MSNEFKQLCDRIKDSPDEIKTYLDAYKERVADTNILINNLNEFGDIADNIQALKKQIQRTTQITVVGLLKGSLGTNKEGDEAKIKKLREMFDNTQKLL